MNDDYLDKTGVMFGREYHLVNLKNEYDMINTPGTPFDRLSVVQPSGHIILCATSLRTFVHCVIFVVVCVYVYLN